MEEDVLEGMEDMTPDAGRNVERYSLCGADLMDTEDAPVGRVTDLVGAGGKNIWEATDDRTAKLKRIKAGKVFGGWECNACNNLHSEFEYEDVVCDECGADRVPFIASSEVQIRSPPD